MDNRVLDMKRFVAVIKYLVGLREGTGECDDIDHLGNRRIKSVGGIGCKIKCAIGLARWNVPLKNVGGHEFF